MLEKIRTYQKCLLISQKITYRRYLFDRIDFDDRMIAIFGVRGVGKTTTMLLQYLDQLQNEGKNALYISLDYPFLIGIDLIDIVETFVQEGGSHLLLDEVHRYHDFGVYLKTIYDLFDLHVIFTGSSATSLLKTRSDLSRRVTLYHLYGFSLREFLELQNTLSFQSHPLQSIIDAHPNIAETIAGQCDILPAFRQYLEQRLNNYTASGQSPATYANPQFSSAEGPRAAEPRSKKHLPVICRLVRPRPVGVLLKRDGSPEVTRAIHGETFSAGPFTK